MTTADLVGRARLAGRGATAINVIGLEHAEAAVRGAERAGLPVVLAISQNAVRFRGGLAPLVAACAALAAQTDAQVALHLDHVQDMALVRQAGGPVSSVMVDASTLPYEQNVERTAAAVRWAHERELWVEAELGEIGGKDGAPPLDAHAPGARTDPDEAAAYVAATGVDGLAVAVGSSHAMLSRTARLDLDLVCALRAVLSVPLVLHGSSGVAPEDLKAAVRAGITKVNIGTALNQAATGAVRRVLSEQPDLADPRRYLAPAREAMTQVVEQALLDISRAA